MYGMSLSPVDALALKIRRAETPFYRRIRDFADMARSSMLPVPRSLKPLTLVFFRLHQGLWRGWGFLRSYFYVGPLFYSRCESVGKSFRVCRMPFVVGHAKIRIGNNVN